MDENASWRVDTMKWNKQNFLSLSHGAQSMVFRIFEAKDPTSCDPRQHLPLNHSNVTCLAELCSWEENVCFLHSSVRAQKLTNIREQRSGGLGRKRRAVWEHSRSEIEVVLIMKNVRLCTYLHISLHHAFCAAQEPDRWTLNQHSSRVIERTMLVVTRLTHIYSCALEMFLNVRIFRFECLKNFAYSTSNIFEKRFFRMFEFQ